MNNYLNLQTTNNFTPELLKTKKQWVLRDENKVPYNPNEPTAKASVSNPDTWATYDVAIAALNNNPHCVGLGFVITSEDDIVVIDLDHCIDETGEITPLAQDVLSIIGVDTYMEVSQSGTGIHIFLRGKKNTKLSKKGEIEVYDNKRYIAMTFNAIYATEPSDKQTELDLICDKFLENVCNVSTNTPVSVNSTMHHANSANIISLIKAEGTAKYVDLINGKWEAHYKSQSEADLALMQKANYYSCGDPSVMKEVWKASGLYRDKLDRDDYIERTIEKAISSCTAHNVANKTTPSSNAFSVISMKEFMETELEKPLFIIDNLISEGLIFLSARPKIGKSFFVTQLGYAVATGTDFLGYPTQKTDVLFFDFEAGEIVRQARNNSQFSDTNVESFMYYKDDNPPKLGKGFEDRLEATLCATPSIKLVIIDMIAQLRTIHNSKSNYDGVYTEFTLLKAIAQKYHVAILLVHHSPKGSRDNDPISGTFGSVAHSGVADTLLLLNNTRKKDIYTLSVTGKNVPAIDLELVYNETTWSRLIGPTSACDEIKKNLVKTIKHALSTGTSRLRCQQILDLSKEIGCEIPSTATSLGMNIHSYYAYIKESGLEMRIDQKNSEKYYVFSNISASSTSFEVVNTPEGYEGQVIV
ncbi:MAG: AAA family ATPase [Lachnospiraceae bacterium]|nr:AAA family ATPase [Lachnospiraceae bacterium]